MRTIHHVSGSIALAVLAMTFLSESPLAQQVDFGDAPAGYATRLVDDGARHVIDGNNLRLGQDRDAEPDGQPGESALQDDANPLMGPDDEDGVTFTGDLIAGAPGSVTVDCQGIGGGTAYLQGWIDGNTDGDWADTGEHVLVDVPLVNGSNLLTFTVPSGPLPGGSTASYARFRVSSVPGLATTGQAADGEVEDYAVELCRVAWLQPPDLSSIGVGVNMDNQAYSMSVFDHDGLADDFIGVKASPITSVHIWTSFKDDNQGLTESMLTTNVLQITIYTNFPPMPPWYPWNMPHYGVSPLWEGTFSPGEYQAHKVSHMPAGEWWLDPGFGDTWYASGGDYCYQYDFHINPTNAPVPEMGGTYWLAVNIPGFEEEPIPGWKSSTGIFNYGSRWHVFSGAIEWHPLEYGGGHPYANLSSPSNLIDLAFALCTEEENPEHKMHWPQLPDPHGWDVRAGNAPQDLTRIVVADDFQCAADGPIREITFWGSWINDDVPVDTVHQDITNLHLAIHADVPGSGGSRPDIPALWTGLINPAAPPPGWQVQPPQEEASSVQGWLDPGEPYWEQGNHQRFFRYDIVIPEVAAFTQTSGTVYWLSISVEAAISSWGCKTSGSAPYGDGAVWAEAPVSDAGQWKPLVDPVTDKPLDLAFFVNGPPDLGSDWGDLPDEYNTSAAENGASHTIVDGIHLGAVIDAEPDGQPSESADGDDTDALYPASGDDEDGVTFMTPLMLGETGDLQVVVPAGEGWLAIWLVSAASGAWSPVLHRVYNEGVSGVTNAIEIAVPDNVPPGPAYLRARLTSHRSAYSAMAPDGEPPPSGPATDGEVEDYQVNLYQSEPKTRLVITNLALTPLDGTLQIYWAEETGAYYQLQANTDIADSEGWIDVGGLLPSPSNGVPHHLNETAEFHRIVVPWVP